jgi:outer membrane murein-binding lipoprotein Lpp
MNETTIAMDINNSSIEELCLVPGLGRAMAERLIAHRPFNRVDDLMNVPGIGDRLLERIRPYLCVSQPVGVEFSPQEVAEAPEKSKPQEEAFPVLLEEEAPADILLAPVPDELENPEDTLPAVVEPEIFEVTSAPAVDRSEILPPPFDAAPEKIPEPASTPATTPVVQKPAPSIKSRPGRLEVLAYVLLGSFLALVMAVLITLGILRILNGDLIYATASRFDGLQSQVGVLNGQISGLQNDITGMRQRLDALEALGGRVSAVEREAQTLRSDLTTAESQIVALETQTEELAAQTEQLAIQTAELQQRTRVFQNFLDGLRDLLTGLAATETK